MASVHKRPHSRNWYAAFYLPDGARALRSTGTSDKRKALRIALEYEEATRKAREGVLTEKRARDAIRKIYEIGNEQEFPDSNIHDFLTDWIKHKDEEASEGTMKEYRLIVKRFIEHLGTKAEKPMDAVTTNDVRSFRTSMLKRVTSGTTNKALKLLRSIWADAVNEGIVSENVVRRVKLVKKDDSKERRAFTLDELKSLLEACGDSEWRGIVLSGLYTGQRLGDVTLLTWRMVDLHEKKVTFIARKTSRRSELPIHSVLLSYFMDLPSTDDLDSYIFPHAASRYNASGASALSKDFRELLINAGIIAPVKNVTGKGTVSHDSTGKGRSAKRSVSGMSFHCLRHTATSLLKNAGVSNAVAMEIIGHDSEAVSRRYSHIESSTLTRDISKMPDVTQ